MSAPLMIIRVLTESWEFDIMHRRAGRDARPWRKVSKHGDAHKNCPLGRCGTRPGPFSEESRDWGPRHGKTAKIVAWRIAKARKNRAYLEEHVYGAKESTSDRVVH